MAVVLPVETGGGGGGRDSTADPDPGVAVVPLVEGAVETRAGVDGVAGWGAGAVSADSNRAIFMCGGGVLKLPSSSINRFGVLMMRKDTVLTTGMINCLMLVNCSPSVLPSLKTGFSLCANRIFFQQFFLLGPLFGPL